MKRIVTFATHPDGAARRLGLLLAVGILLSDRLSKIWILEGLRLTPGDTVPLLPFFNLTFVWNRGISLGLLQQDGDTGRWLLILVTSFVALFLAVWLWRAAGRWTAAAIGLILGGAVGNIWDRIAFGAVADFLHFHVGGWSFYIFNVADAAISVGVGMLLIESLFGDRAGTKAKDTNAKSGD